MRPCRKSCDMRDLQRLRGRPIWEAPPGELQSRSWHGHLGRETQARCLCYCQTLDFAVLLEAPRKPVASTTNAARDLPQAAFFVDFRRASLWNAGRVGRPRLPPLPADARRAVSGLSALLMFPARLSGIGPRDDGLPVVAQDHIPT